MGSQEDGILGQFPVRNSFGSFNKGRFCGPIARGFVQQFSQIHITKRALARSLDQRDRPCQHGLLIGVRRLRSRLRLRKKPKRTFRLLERIWRQPTLAEPIGLLPSARLCLTAEFGMGSGRTTALWPPKNRNGCRVSGDEGKTSSLQHDRARKC